MTLRLAQVAEVRLGRQRAPRFEQGDHLIPYLRSANVVDGSLDLTDVKSMNFDPVEQSIFGLADGDVLMTEGSGSAETVGTSAVWRVDLPGTVCFQNTLLRLRPRPGVTDGRFLAWWARHAHASGQIAAVTSGANIQHIGSDGLKDLRLHVPDLGEQQRIADFLDDRVARIDQIITARGIQLDLINEVAVSGTSDLLGAVGPEGPPLSAVCRIVDTEHKTAPTVAGGGYWIAGTGAIRDGRLVHDRLRETDSDSFTEWTSRGVPEHGDVLLTREAPVGEVALVSVGDPPVAIGQRVVLLKPNAKALDSGFLRLVLMAGEIRRIIAMASAGSLHPHLNMADIARLRIPNSALEDQRSLGRAHQQILMQAQSRRSTLGGSLDRLIEYKQSLITAAVTGELDVTTAGSGIPG